MLLGGAAGTVKNREAKRRKPFSLPTANQNMRRVYAYLVKHRGIDRSVVTHFVKAGLLYEDAQYHNAVFVGTDEHSVACHAHKRSTNSNSFGKAFRQNVEGSDPKYSFHHIGTDGSLYVFEAPIDLLSYISLHPEDWSQHSYVACCGTSAQPVMWILDRLPQVQEVFLCLDNDEAGHTASLRIAERIGERGIAADRLLPQAKDWNEDLIAKKRTER